MDQPIQKIPPSERPKLVGSSSGPEPPFPIYLKGIVSRGFGRGSKQLGCPTANLPDESFAPYANDLYNGVFFGYASVNLPDEAQNPVGSNTGEKEEHEKVWPMVMSVGWNPYFKNEKKTAEVHIMHDFRQDFYDQEQRVIVLGRIRSQFDYTSIEALMEDIDMDKTVALNSLARAEWKKYEKDGFLQF